MNSRPPNRMSDSLTVNRDLRFLRRKCFMGFLRYIYSFMVWCLRVLNRASRVCDTLEFWDKVPKLNSKTRFQINKDWRKTTTDSSMSLISKLL